jgi:hypothetical protein
MKGLILRMFEDNVLRRIFPKRASNKKLEKVGLHNLHPSLNVDMNSESIRARLM